MKILLESEDADGVIVETVECSSASEARLKAVAGRKNFLHICYNDESPPRPCSRTEL